MAKNEILLKTIHKFEKKITKNHKISTVKLNNVNINGDDYKKIFNDILLCFLRKELKE